MRFALTLAALALLAGDAAAQTAPSSRVPVVQPSPGERVRLNYGVDGSATVHGTWVAMDPHGVRLLATPQDTVQVALDRLVSLERSTGTQRHTRTGALVGGLVGLVAGFVVARGDETAENWDMESVSMASSALLGALVGMVAGGVVGATIKTERWEVVPLRPAGN